MRGPSKIKDMPPDPEDVSQQIAWLKEYLKLPELKSMLDPNIRLNVEAANNFVERIELVMNNLATIVLDKIEKSEKKKNKTEKVNTAIQKIEEEFKLTQNIDSIRTRIQDQKLEELKYLVEKIDGITNRINIRCGLSSDSTKIESKLESKKESSENNHYTKPGGGYHRL